LERAHLNLMRIFIFLRVTLICITVGNF